MKIENRDALLDELCKSKNADKILEFLHDLSKHPKITRGFRYSLICVEKDYRRL
jgi:hypothetical protein